MPNVSKVLKYAKSLVGIKYKCWEGEDTMAKEPFWAENKEVPSTEYLSTHAICCAGLINLIRRYLNLSVPGVEEKYRFSGGTWIWYKYLLKKDVLIDFNINKKYPRGTLLIRKYKNIEDQGHVAIIYSSKKDNVLYEKVIHSYYPRGVQIDSALGTSHFWLAKGYYTHACLPQNWLAE
jgi:hypothetical protein